MYRLNLTADSTAQARTMIFAALTCAALLIGCSGDPALPNSPTAPAVEPVSIPNQSIPKVETGSVAGFVINESDDCIIGARVEVVDGPHAGDAFRQTVCGFWDYGDDIGYVFGNLPVGTSVTLRATAEGYKSAEIHAFPSRTYSYTNMILLTREP